MKLTTLLACWVGSVLSAREGEVVALEEDNSVPIGRQLTAGISALDKRVVRLELIVSELKQGRRGASSAPVSASGGADTFEPGNLAGKPTAELSGCTYDALVQAAESKSDAQVIRAASLPANFEQCSAELDRFLAEHRWWVVVTEPFARFEGSDQKPVVLRRIPEKSEKFMRKISTSQFPMASECPSRTLALYQADGGWGSLMNQHRKAFQNAVMESHSIFETYMKAPWSKIGRNFCPEADNEWRCMFLPATNCPMPSAAEAPCEKSGCMRSQSYGVPRYYTKAAENGVSITKQSDGSDLGELPYKTKFFSIDDSEFEPNKLIDVHHFVRPKFAFDGHFLWYAYRFNARFRSLMQAKAIEFAETERVVQGRLAKTGNQNCVAIHVRLGDRVRHMDMDQMRAWCKKYPEDHDVGCGYPEETWWAGLTLERYLKRAQEHFDELGGGNTVFVMTQNATWVDEQVKIYANVTKRYNIYRMAGGRDNERGDASLQYTRSIKTQNTIIFWTSVMLAQRCNAFVGSFGSDVSKLVYRNMCYQHGDKLGACPPATTMTVRL